MTKQISVSYIQASHWGGGNNDDYSTCVCDCASECINNRSNICTAAKNPLVLNEENKKIVKLILLMSNITLSTQIKCYSLQSSVIVER